MEEEMDQLEYFIYASPEDSEALYPDNKFTDFVVELPETLYLDGHWEIGLLEVVYNTNAQKEVHCPMGPSILFFCDICDESFVRGHRLPVLRKMEKPATFAPVIYKRVKACSTKRIRLYMTDYDLIPLTLGTWKFKCVLHLRKAI